jgi:hypothetical protein
MSALLSAIFHAPRRYLSRQLAELWSTYWAPVNGTCHLCKGAAPEDDNECEECRNFMRGY